MPVRIGPLGRLRAILARFRACLPPAHYLRHDMVPYICCPPRLFEHATSLSRQQANALEQYIVAISFAKASQASQCQLHYRNTSMFAICTHPNSATPHWLLFEIRLHGQGCCEAVCY